MDQLTIITTTYNRYNMLKRAYKSLCNQGYKEFVWIIIDDGSTDNTDLLVKQWIEEGTVKIKYYYQENHGVTFSRHVARMMVKTPWMTVLDSDDYYRNNSLDVIMKLIEKYDIEHDKKCMGVLFPVDSKSTNDIEEGKHTLTELYYKYNYVGEYQTVEKTNEWNRFQPPHFINESFVPESVYLRQIDYYYYYECFNMRFMKREYHSDGLTRNIANVIDNNPIGQAYAMKVDCVYGKDMGLFKRIQAYIDFRNYSSFKLGEPDEIFPELVVPLIVRKMGKFILKYQFIRCIKGMLLYKFPKRKVKRNTDIVIWGAGNMGKAYFEYINCFKYCNVILWCDSNYAVKMGEGLDVKSPEIIGKYKFDYVVIAIESVYASKNVKNILINMGIDEKKIVEVSE